MFLSLLCSLFFVIVLIIITYNVYLLIFNYRVVKFSWSLNQKWLPNIPMFGTMYPVFFAKLDFLSALIWADKWFGLPGGVWFGRHFIYVTDIAEEARIIFKHPKCLDKSKIYDNAKIFFGNSLISVPAELWKPRRRFLNPAFKIKVVEEFTEIFFAQSRDLIGKLKHRINHDGLLELFHNYTMKTFFLTSSGFNEEDLDVDIDVVAPIFISLQDQFAKVFVNPLLPPNLWLSLPMSARFRQENSKLRSELNKLLVQKKKEKLDHLEVQDSKDLRLIDLLLSDEFENMPFSDVVEEFFLFSIAATDTTAGTLAVCFTILGMYPEIQNKVLKEVEEVFEDQHFNNSTLSELKYTEMVICETLRLFPPGPLPGRYCSEDIDLGNKVIPKGVNICVSIYHIHRKQEYWKNPLVFDPERFSKENIQKIVPGSFTPFCDGPRKCIGERVGMLMMKITIANVVRSCQIVSKHSSLDEMILESCITMKIANPLDCQFIERAKN